MSNWYTASISAVTSINVFSPYVTLVAVTLALFAAGFTLNSSDVFTLSTLLSPLYTIVTGYVPTSRLSKVKNPCVFDFMTGAA